VAARHLTEGQIAISGIAFLPGFSEPSAFHRAFKRWTGHAPLTYRELALPRKQRGVDIKQQAIANFAQ
jgi:AraC-like DNA-binding protein